MDTKNRKPTKQQGKNLNKILCIPNIYRILKVNTKHFCFSDCFHDCWRGFVKNFPNLDFHKWFYVHKSLKPKVLVICFIVWQPFF